MFFKNGIYIPPLDNIPVDAELERGLTSNFGYVHEETPPFRHLLALLSSRGKLIFIPTIGWGEVENNVTVDQYTPFTRLTIADGAPAGDGRAYIGFRGLNPAGWQRQYIDWEKELLLQFVVCRNTAEATSPPLCYVQLKPTSAAGALAADGLGIRIGDDGNDPHTADRKLYGESYGVGGSDEVVDLSLVLSSSRDYTIGIHHKPGEFVRWHVNGAPLGTQSIANHVPAGTSGATVSLVVSADKSATDPDAEVDLEVSNFLIWQAH